MVLERADSIQPASRPLSRAETNRSSRYHVNRSQTKGWQTQSVGEIARASSIPAKHRVGYMGDSRARINAPKLPAWETPPKTEVQIVRKSTAERSKEQAKVDANQALFATGVGSGEEDLGRFKTTAVDIDGSAVPARKKRGGVYDTLLRKLEATESAVQNTQSQANELLQETENEVSRMDEQVSRYQTGTIDIQREMAQLAKSQEMLLQLIESNALEIQELKSTNATGRLHIRANGGAPPDSKTRIPEEQADRSVQTLHTTAPYPKPTPKRGQVPRGGGAGMRGEQYRNLDAQGALVDPVLGDTLSPPPSAYQRRQFGDSGGNENLFVGDGNGDDDLPPPLPRRKVNTQGLAGRLAAAQSGLAESLRSSTEMLRSSGTNPLRRSLEARESTGSGGGGAAFRPDRVRDSHDSFLDAGSANTPLDASPVHGAGWHTANDTVGGGYNSGSYVSGGQTQNQRQTRFA